MSATTLYPSAPLELATAINKSLEKNTKKSRQRASLTLLTFLMICSPTSKTKNVNQKIYIKNKEKCYLLH